MSSPPTGTLACPKCKMQVPAKAYVCAFCKKRLRTGPVALGCLILVVFSVGITIFVSTQNPTPGVTSAASQSADPPILSPDQAKKQSEAAKVERDRFLKTKAGRIWAKHKDWSPVDCELIAKRNARIGMTADQVRAAWGKPASINSSVYASGTHEQWVYGSNQYVYFENGVMTALQQSK